MDLEELQKNWDEFGKTDPLWAILSAPERKGGKWDPAEFFASGRREIDVIMQKAEALGFPAHREAALDFGCGVGRLTQALCEWFETCRGVDIAPSMIEQARQYNAHPGKCDYFLNADTDLHIFPDASFDFIYTNLVLQHMEPRYSTSYMREFVRVSRPGGLIVFQIPARPRATAAESLGQTDLGPMPDGGFRARLTGFPPTIHAAGGSPVYVPVTIENVGECVWPSVGNSQRKYAVKLGNHWLKLNGETVIWDDARRLLPYDLPPHAEPIQTGIHVTAPTAAGEYILELDMVQETVAWFKQKSSAPAWVRAHIEPAPIPADSKDPPRMEMYGLEKGTVVEILTSSGAKVLDIVPDRSAGPEWISFRYFATRV